MKDAMNANKLAKQIEAAKPKHLVEMRSHEQGEHCHFKATFTRQRSIRWTWSRDCVADIVTNADTVTRLAHALGAQAASMLPKKKPATTQP
jgi:hypothetical protein